MGKSSVDMVPGARFSTNNYGHLTIVKYIDKENVRVKFDTGFETTTHAVAIRRGQVRDPLFPTYFGVGFEGIGAHSLYVLRAYTVAGQVWKGMLERCYSQARLARGPTYHDCSVDQEWYNFQAFAEWFYAQPNAGHIGFALDKDLLLPGNRIYGPTTCCIVPLEINSLLIDRAALRGPYPIGVQPNRNLFQARCNFFGTLRSGGHHETIAEAFKAFCELKAEAIHQTALKYKDQIPEAVFSRLSNIDWSDIHAKYGDHPALK